MVSLKMNLQNATKLNQLKYLIEDTNALLGKNKFRIIVLVFNRSFWGVLSYRLDRFLFGIFGNTYKYFRIILSPIFYILQIISNCDIHYKADIKGGVNIHHPALGIVISGKAEIKESLTLTGGNTIGIKSGHAKGKIKIGKNVNFGANACVIGPLVLGDNIKIAAMACVVSSFEENNKVLLGIPAKCYKE